MTKPKFPLSVPVKAGLANIKRLGLRAETSIRDNVMDYMDFSSVLYSAHAPIRIGEELLNIAATDDEFRELSITTFKNYLDKCGTFANIRQFNMHFALKRWISDNQRRGQIGEYERHIESIRILAEHAAYYDIEIVLENLNSHWNTNGISPNTPWDVVDWSNKNEVFGMSPEEWLQICLDVDRSNVRLCLDSSHICTYAHRFPEHDRERIVFSFLKEPQLITHVHWSDNYLYDVRGRDDSHLSVGKGTLPVEFHRTIKRLDATILLEHFYSLDELEEELDFIYRL